MHRLRHPYVLITSALLLGLIVAFATFKKPVKQEQQVAERLADGRKPSMKLMVPVWLHRGLVVNIGLAACLLALAPLACRSLDRRREERKSAPFRPTLAQGLALGGAAAIFLSAGIPRLHHSFWGDEEFASGRFIADQVEVSPEGQVHIERTSWLDTIWNFWRPTNHIGYTVVARLSHEAFFSPTNGPTDPYFSETWVRLPTLLAGLASLLAIVWICHVWGWSRAAPAVVLAWAGHAWLVRFGVDARGYGFVTLLLILLIGIVGRALQTGRWRWWLLMGFVQFYVLWTHLGAVYFPLGMAAAALAMIWTDEIKEDRLVQSTRWLVGNLFTVLLAVGIMAPQLVPFLKFMDQHVLPGSLDLAWFKDAACYLACGAPWLPWSATNPFSTSVRDQGLPMVLDVLVLVISWALVVLGVVRLCKDRSQRWLILFLIGAPVLMILHIIVGHTRPYHWYLIPFIPALLALWASGLTGLFAKSRAAGMVVGIVFVFGTHALAWQQSRLLVQHPIEANRESVALTRQVTNPRHPDYGKEALTAHCIMTPGCYDPAGIRFETVADLRALMARADREHKPLFVNFGFRELYAETKPDILALLDDRTLFEPVASLPGLFISTSREVVRYRSPLSPP